MEEQEPRSQEQQPSGEATCEPAPSVGVDTKRNEKHDAYSASDDAYYRDSQIDHFTDEFFGWLHSQNIRLAEAIMAFSSIAMLIVVGWQVYSSPTSGQTKQLIDQATIQAAAAEKFRIAAEGIDHGIGDAVTKLNLQATALGTSATQAGRLASATEQANGNVINADRHWFGGALSVEGFEVDKIPGGTIIFVNSGRRPAKVTLTESMSHWFKDFPPNPPYEFDTTPSAAIIVPNGTLVSKFSLLKKAMTKEELDFANDGKVATFFVYANIEYSDVRTNATHYAHFCWRYIGNTPTIAKGFYGCREYNDTDQEK